MISQKDTRPKKQRSRDLTAQELREAIHYDPDTGIFTWRRREGWKWNKKLGGERAGYANVKGIAHRTPYRLIWLKDTNRREHRLAWLYMTGSWPDGSLDHINRDGLDNRWKNLRIATVAQNAMNAKMPSTNTVGVKGVSRYKCGGYQARIGIDGRVKALGVYKTAEEAHAVYMREARRIFGEFARAK